MFWFIDRFADALANDLDEEFPGQLEYKMIKDAGTTGAFEITLGGKLIHSKLTKGQGKCESAAEKEAVKQAIREFKSAN